MALPVLLPDDTHRRARSAKILAKRALRRIGKDDLAGPINTRTHTYGPAAVKGIKSLQRYYGLVADGIVGPATWQMLIRRGSLIPRRQYTIHPRRSWGPLGRKKPAERTIWVHDKTPFWLHHTVTREPKSTIEAEKAAMRDLQRIAFGRGYSDISYSYIVFPSGNIYEGRGFEIVGAHTKGHNDDIGVALVGNYDKRQVTDAQYASVMWLYRKLKAGSMGPHCLVYPTACPGKNALSKFGLKCK